jgi:hypothetical protein
MAGRTRHRPTDLKQRLPGAPIHHPGRRGPSAAHPGVVYGPVQFSFVLIFCFFAFSFFFILFTVFLFLFIFLKFEHY